jgi:two-component system response regulator PilR (NtrC family)
MQVKLLRAIQEKQVRRVGSTVEEPVDVRLLSATHQNLGALVGTGKFRQDLLYRLDVIDIKMPALREYREDIPALAQAILARLAQQNGRSAVLSAAALVQLKAYDYPGNVRELENVLERAMALAVSEEIDVADLRLMPAQLEVGERPAGASGSPGRAGAMQLQEYLDRAEREAILAALAETGNNRTAAAKLLGVTFRSLRYRLQRLNIVD